MNRFLVVLGAVLLTLPLSFAFDCSVVDADLCAEIETSDWSDEEKLAAYTALTYQEFPDFDEVLTHNQNVNITEVPDEADYDSASYIEFAWIDILSLEPSVMINGTLHSPGEGELLTTYDYQVNTPSGTQAGDCRTEYSVGTSGTYKTYLNGEETDEFTFTEDSTIEAELRVSVSVRITHYTWQAIRGRMRCGYDYQESRSSSVTVSDSVDVVYYNPEVNYDLDVFNQAYGASHGTINTENETAFDLIFENSLVSKRNWHYYYSLSSVDVITIVAEEYEYLDSENINLDEEFNFVVPSSESCAITLYSHFYNTTYDCSEEFVDDEISIDTDKQFYSVGEEISVDIENYTEDLFLHYAGEDYALDDEIIAEESGLLTVTDGNTEYSTMVYVKSNEWETLSDFGLFGGFIYVLSNSFTILWRKIGI